MEQETRRGVDAFQTEDSTSCCEIKTSRPKEQTYVVFTTTHFRKELTQRVPQLISY